MWLSCQEVEVGADESARVHDRVAFVISVNNKVVGLARFKTAKCNVTLSSLVRAVGRTDIVHTLACAEIRSLVGILDDESSIRRQIFVEGLPTYIIIINVHDTFSVLLSIPDTNVCLSTEVCEWCCRVAIV